MIAVVYGTSGELIKLAPVIVRLEKRGAAITTWCTGQQSPELLDMVDSLSLPHPDLWLGEGFRRQPIRHPRHALSWASVLAGRFAFHYRAMRAMLRQTSPSIVLVHGDTFTTVAGALMGKALGVPVGHVEAGLRSHDWRNPFPEELNRRLTTRIADVHLAPGSRAVAALQRARGTVVDTGLNTVYDSLELVPDRDSAELPVLPDGFGIVSLHRFELLRDRDVFSRTIEVLAEGARTRPMVFIDHPTTAVRLAELGLDDAFDGERFVRIPKLDYLSFITLLRQSSFAITDSAGLQQESAYLNHPCLVHRLTVESSEGLGSNVVVSQFDMAVLDEFLANPDRYRGDDMTPLPSPSDVVVDWLVDHGYDRARRSTRVTRPRPAFDPSELLSVVVPFYRPGEPFDRPLRQLMEALHGLPVPHEVIIAATAGTAPLLAHADAELVVTGGTSKDAALRAGLGAARGTHVAFVDLGMGLHPDGIGRLLDQLDEQDLDVVIGAKAHADSRVYYPPFRRFQSRTLGRIVRALFGVGVSDAQAGLKVFRRAVLDEVFPAAGGEGFRFDLEVLVRASDAGYRVGEGPVQLDYRFAATAGWRAVAQILGDIFALAAERAWRRARGRWAEGVAAPATR